MTLSFSDKTKAFSFWKISLILSLFSAWYFYLVFDVVERWGVKLPLLLHISCQNAEHMEVGRDSADYLISLENSKKNYCLRNFFANINIFNNNSVFFCIFCVLMLFLYFLYYLLPRITQILFYSCCKLMQVTFSTNNNVI